MICILASAQLCDTLFPNIMENNKSAVEHAHCCVYYLFRSTFYRESVCLLSESNLKPQLCRLQFRQDINVKQDVWNSIQHLLALLTVSNIIHMHLE